MAATESWYKCDPITGWRSPVSFDKDGKEWNIRWFGDAVVEYKAEDDCFKIINHYQEKEYKFDDEFLSCEEAIKVLVDLFPYADYDFVEKENMVWFKEYKKDSNVEIASRTIDEYKYENGKIIISLEDLHSIIWMEEVNENNQATIK